MKSKNMMYRLTVSSCLVVFLSSNALASHSPHPVKKQPHSTLDITRYLDHDVIDHEKENYILMAQARAAKKVPKNVKGKLTLKQKLNFKLKKRSLNQKKSEAKKTLKEANAAKKITDKALKRAAKRASASQGDLDRRELVLSLAKVAAQRKTGTDSLLANYKVNKMQGSFDRASAKHTSGPLAAHRNALANAEISNSIQFAAKNNLGRIRADLAVRKQQKNNERAKNLQQAQAKKLAKQDKRGAKPNLNSGIYGKFPPPRPRRTQEYGDVSQLRSAGQNQYGVAPPPRAGQQQMSHYSLAPPPASAIYGPGPAAARGN